MQTTELPQLKARVRVHHDATGKMELLGFADLIIGESFVINGIRILRSPARDGKPESTFLSFPSRKEKEGGADKYVELAHPITASARRAASQAVLAAYAQVARS